MSKPTFRYVCDAIAMLDVKWLRYGSRIRSDGENYCCPITALHFGVTGLCLNVTETVEACTDLEIPEAVRVRLVKAADGANDAQAKRDRAVLLEACDLQPPTGAQGA